LFVAAITVVVRGFFWVQSPWHSAKVPAPKDWPAHPYLMMQISNLLHKKSSK